MKSTGPRQGSAQGLVRGSIAECPVNFLAVTGSLAIDVNK